MASFESKDDEATEYRLAGLVSSEKLENLGTAVKDLLPIPSDTAPVTDPGQTDVSHTLMDDPSLSHELATDDHEVKGLAQQEHTNEVLDLGWNQQKQEIAQPLVGGLDNEELWMLVRRFDKVSKALGETLRLYTMERNRLTSP